MLVSKFPPFSGCSVHRAKSSANGKPRQSRNDRVVISKRSYAIENDNQNDLSDDFWLNINNQRDHIQRIATKLGVQKPEDWYHVMIHDVKRCGGDKILKYYNNSLYDMLSTVAPQVTWTPWRFIDPKEVTFSSYWKEASNIKQFFQSMEKEFHINRVEDWFKVKKYDGLLHHFEGSVAKALSSLYPSYPVAVRNFFDYISKDFNIHSLDDWYEVTPDEVRRRGGHGILSHHDGNLIKALSTAYPQHHWKSNVAPKGHWTDAQHHREFFNKFAKTFGINGPEQWLSVRYSYIIEHGGGPLLKHYSNSLHKALAAVYPEYLLLQRNFFDNLGKELKVNSLEDWYTVDTNEVRSRGGGSILAHYGGSLLKALSVAYPEYPWKAARVPTGHWKDIQNQRYFFDQMALSMNIKKHDDWYQVTVQDVIDQGGQRLLSIYGGSVIKALTAVYPEHNWKTYKFYNPHQFVRKTPFESKMSQGEFLRYLKSAPASSALNDYYQVASSFCNDNPYLLETSDNRLLVHKLLSLSDPSSQGHASFTTSKRQMALYRSVKNLFPKVEVQLDYLHPDLKFAETKRVMELDVFIPSLSLALEYQGRQHYRDIGFKIMSVQFQQRRDKEKEYLCMQKGITLIQVPYWWDGREASLAATIHRYRKDLLPESYSGVPISLHEPGSEVPSFQTRNIQLPSADWDPSGYWLIPKAAGMDVYWNGNGNLISYADRRRISLHPSIMNDLPIGMTFEGTFVQNGTAQYLFIYDTPLSNHKFEDRMKLLKEYVPSNSSIILIQPIFCTSWNHAMELAHKLSDRDILATRPSSFYNDDNSTFYLKRMKETAARVVDYSGGTLLCSKPGGNLIALQSTLQPPLRSVITFTEHRLSVAKNNSINTSLKRTRHISWDDVCKGHYGYYLSYGKSSRPTCRGCGKQLDKQVPRIKATILLRKDKNIPLQSATVNFCAALECIQSALWKYGKEGTIAPNFTGQVFVPSEMRDTQLPTITGVTWITN